MRSARQRAIAWILRLAAVALVAAAVAEGFRPHERRCFDCNIILISADTLRADHLGCYGYEPETSPAIDRLARESVLFARAYSVSGWTLPGHMAMFTGRYPVQESEFVFSSKMPFSASYPRLPQILRQAGYATAAFIGGGFVGDAWGFGQGFDSLAGGGREFENNRALVGKWLAAREPRHPFFLFLHGYDVHEPHDPPADLRLRFIDAVPDECVGVELRCAEADLACRKSPRGREYLLSQYDAEVLGIDRFVGWLVAELKRRDLYDDTILVFTSDHGEALMERDTLSCGHMGLSECVFRVPLIMHLPRSQPRIVEPRVSLVDLAPTLLDILGLPAAGTMHGQSLVPLLEGIDRGRQINGVSGNDPGNFALASIADDTKLMKWRWNRGSPWVHEMYDLASDPAAEHNLLPQNGPPPPLFYAIQDRQEAWVQKIGLRLGDEPAAGQPTAPALPPEVKDQLEKLGYR